MAHDTNPEDTTCPCPASKTDADKLFVGPAPEVINNPDQNVYDDPYFLYSIIFCSILLVIIGILCHRCCKRKKGKKPKQLQIVKTIESDSDKIEDQDIDQEVVDEEIIVDDVGDIDENIKLLCNNINIT